MFECIAVAATNRLFFPALPMLPNFKCQLNVDNPVKKIIVLVYCSILNIHELFVGGTLKQTMLIFRQYYDVVMDIGTNQTERHDKTKESLKVACNL